MSGHALRARRTLAPGPAFVVVATLIALVMFASASPSALYSIYQAEWGFSPFVLTVVYAAQCVGVLVALIFLGSLPDAVGRRPVLLAGMAGLVLATVIFLLASSAAWLIVARAVQGLAGGVILAAASAALLDLDQRGDPDRVGLINGVPGTATMGLGAMTAAVLADVAPAPLVTPFLLLLGLSVVALAATVALPESLPREGRPRWRPAAPRIPPSIRGTFALAALAILASWSITGVYLALSSSIADELLHSDRHVVGGAPIFVMFTAAAIAQVTLRRWSARLAMIAGAVLLGGGMALGAASIVASSAVVFLTASAIVGVGFGITFAGALRAVSAVVPDDHRAEVMAAFYVVAYTSTSIPPIAAGIAASAVGLAPTLYTFTAITVALSVALAAGAVRSGQPAAAPPAR